MSEGLALSLGFSDLFSVLSNSSSLRGGFFLALYLFVIFIELFE